MVVDGSIYIWWVDSIVGIVISVVVVSRCSVMGFMVMIFSEWKV